MSDAFGQMLPFALVIAVSPIPYFLVLAVGWTVSIAAWYLLGLPWGPRHLSDGR